jgi:hypothetical protein
MRRLATSQAVATESQAERVAYKSSWAAALSEEMRAAARTATSF